MNARLFGMYSAVPLKVWKMALPMYQQVYHNRIVIALERGRDTMPGTHVTSGKSTATAKTLGVSNATFIFQMVQLRNQLRTFHQTPDGWLVSQYFI